MDNHDAWKKEVEAILDEVRPALEMHGGGATLVSIEDKKVVLKLHGSCHGCPMSAMTFGVMVDEMIKERIPDVEEVVYEDAPAV